MLRFFRRIRQKLITEGHLSKYLIYALGEILLVVAGILIALQINNWNQDRNNRETERTYLNGLKSDLEYNLEQLNHYDEVLDIKVDVLKRILNGTYDKISHKRTSSELSGNGAYDIFYSRFNYNVEFRNNTYKEMLSNGGISLIESEVLRQEIFDHYGLLLERINALQNGKSNWSNFLSSMIPGEHYVVETHSDISDHFSEKGLEILITRLKEDLEKLRPVINTEIQYASRAFRNIRFLEAQTKQMIQLIDQELKNR